MYEASFGLGPAPFRLMPDPRFYLDDGQYGALLAKLIEGLEAGEPCLLLTGPAGSGKTAAVQRLLTVLDRRRWTVGAMFASADAAGADVLHAVAYAFNLARTDMQPGPAFDAWLPREIARGRRVLLVVDEAEHLDEGALRQLAERLSRARGAPGLQLCLVGEQPPASLADAVRDGVLPAAGVHCRLRALDATETRDYVLHRLRCAGWKGRPAFDRAATDAIHRRSEGIPRRIHLIADRVLLQLSLDAVDVATAADVEIADDLRTVELQGRAPVEVLPTAGAAAARAGPHIGANVNPDVDSHVSSDVTAAPRGEPLEPLEPLAPLAPFAPFAPLELRRLPDGATPGGRPSAGTSGAGAGRVHPEQTTAPRSTFAVNRKAAAGAIVVALAGIGIGWWLGVGGAVPPTALPRNAELESARAAATAPASGRTELADSASPAAAPAALPTTSPATSPATSPVADPEPLTPAAPAPALVIADPGVVAGPMPSASPPSAEPPPATANAAATATAKVGTGGPSPAEPLRSANGGVPSAGPVRDARDAAPTGGLPRDARRTVAAVPAAPAPPPCTRAAAVLGLCEPAAARPLPASPPVRTAMPAADAVPPEPQRAAPPAPTAAPATPLAPCAPSRAALGLCER